MRELIKTSRQQIGGTTQNTVDARELYQTLDVKRDFSNWIKGRIDGYGFVESVDYFTFAKIGERKKGQRGAAKRKEYTLSVDMAKELAMVEKSDKGRLVRQYFIACERVAKRSLAGHLVLNKYLVEVRYTRDGERLYKIIDVCRALNNNSIRAGFTAIKRLQKRHNDLQLEKHLSGFAYCWFGTADVVRLLAQNSKNKCSKYVMSDLLDIEFTSRQTSFLPQNA